MERLTLNRAGPGVLTLKAPYREGTTPIVMSPREFMQRLAALVPRPRLHLIESIHPWIGRQLPCCSDACGVRFHGVLAPTAHAPCRAHSERAGQR
jgi:hypothetical protein